jgi:hypothetical protein
MHHTAQHDQTGNGNGLLSAAGCVKPTKLVILHDAE